MGTENQLLCSQLVHDLKNFLTVVFCTSQLILEESNCESAHYYVQQIIRSCGAVERLLEEVLNLSQVELGKLPLKLHDIAIVDELRTIVEAHKLHAKEKSLALVLRFDGPIPRQVRTDSLRLQQILSNLIGNAVKFTPSGKVDVVCHHDGENLSVMVADTGTGIDTSDRTRVFEPYHRPTEEKSHGLGLPLARRLARLLGGDVCLLDSKRGMGSSFLVVVKAPISPGCSDPEEFVYAGIFKCT